MAVARPASLNLACLMRHARIMTEAWSWLFKVIVVPDDDALIQLRPALERWLAKSEDH